MKMLKWNQHSAEGCPTCNQMEGKIKSDEAWESSKIQPKVNTQCGDKCTCTLDEVETGMSSTAGTLAPGTAQLTTESQDSDVTLQLTATATEEGFNILAINAGEAKGHGIRFSEAVLQEAVPLYESKPVFIDHSGFGNSPSVRNLAGVLQMAVWNTSQRGISATLIPAGPASDILLSVRNAAKSNPAIMDTVGFSTVLNVRLNKAGDVLKVVSVKSIDVVIDPARGGRFLQALTNSQTEGGLEMSETLLVDTHSKGRETESPDPSIAAQLEANRQAAAVLLGETERQRQLDAQLQASNETLIAMSEHLLNSGLSGSRLPEVTQGRIRKQFAGRAFKAVELSAAISEARDEITALTQGMNITGPGRVQITGMVDNRDQFRLAVEDLFDVPRSDAEKNVRVHKLAGIREAYLMATGDQDFYGGFYPEFALVTGNFPSIIANVQNKILLKAWDDFEEAYGWWRHIATIEHFNNLNTATWVRTGTIASLPSVAEQGSYTELPIGDIKETSEWGKYGGYVPLTIEAVLRDDLRAFKRMPREAALAGIRNISEQVAAIFTQNSAAGPTMTDGGALFNSTAQTTAGGHVNLLTTALGTTYTAWDAVATAMYKKKLMVKNATGYYGTGKPQALKPSICLVPADLIAAAEALFVPRWDAPSQNVPATQSPRWGGRVLPLAVPDWTDATDWAAVIDPKLRPGIMIGEIFGVKPVIFSASSEMDPAMFANDESRLKVRQIVTVGVADDLPLHKNNVT